MPSEWLQLRARDRRLIPFNAAGIRDTAHPYTEQLPGGQRAGSTSGLTQLRNLLAGTRPQPNPTLSNPGRPTRSGRSTATTTCRRRWHRGRHDLLHAQRHRGLGGDILVGTNPPRVQRQRTTAPVAGRWGEAQSIPGVPFTIHRRPAVREPGGNSLQQPGPRGLFARRRRPASTATSPATPPTTTTTRSTPSGRHRLAPARSATSTSTTPPAACCCRSSGCGGS